jgi:hypothetical protein
MSVLGRGGKKRLLVIAELNLNNQIPIHCSHLFGSLHITQWKAKAGKSFSQEVIINDWQGMSPQEQWDIKLMHFFFFPLSFYLPLSSLFLVQFNAIQEGT